MTARVGVVTFPGSLDDRDALRAVAAAGAEPVSLWHKDADLHGVDAVVLPGGFSYGDYLRCGAIARFSPVMDLVIAGAHAGLPVLGHLQRLSGAVRGALVARRFVAQRAPALPLHRPGVGHRERQHCLDQRVRAEARG